jgi:hypothetical protein
MPEKDPFADLNEVKSSAIKWGKPGDWVKGTLTDNSREVPNRLSSKNEMQRIFEFKVSGGSFHFINEDKSVAKDPTVLETGSYWSVYAKPGLATQLRNAKLGQIVGLRYERDEAPKVKGNNPTKIIKAFLGEMDSTYQGESKGDELPAF